MSHSRSVTFTEPGSAKPAVEYPATSSNVDATPAVPSRTDATSDPSASTTTSMNCSHNCDTTSHGESDPSRYTIGPVAGERRTRIVGRLGASHGPAVQQVVADHHLADLTSDRHLRIRRRILEDLRVVVAASDDGPVRSAQRPQEPGRVPAGRRRPQRSPARTRTGSSPKQSPRTRSVASAARCRKPTFTPLTYAVTVLSPA